MRPTHSTSLFSTLAIGAAFAFGLVVAGAVPALAQGDEIMVFRGYLRDAQGPVNATYDVRTEFFASALPSDGEATLWAETFTGVSIVDGFFVVPLGGETEGGVPAGLVPDECFLQITVDGEVLAPRVAMTPVPTALYATEAGVAETLSGFDPTTVPAPLVFDCGRGNVAQGVGSDGNPICVPLAELIAEAGVLTADSTVSWGQIGDMPPGFADGEDDDTVLDEATVDGMVADNGYLDGASPIAWNRLTGVPEGFADGVDDDRVLSAAQVGSIAESLGFLGKTSHIDWSRIDNIPRGFADGVDDDVAWPEGPYCILRFSGSCPQGFDEGYRFWDDEDSDNENRASGTVPDGAFDDNTSIFFCCRTDLL